MSIKTLAAGTLTLLLLSGCSSYDSAPREMQARNPTVTYQYRGDQELLAANQRAMGYCSQFHSAARTSAITDVSDGRKNVVFECEPLGPMQVSAERISSNPGYRYRTDAELFDLSRNAEIFCMRDGGQRANSTLSVNSDGSHTVMFQCAP